jgi:hypothetical protein
MLGQLKDVSDQHYKARHDEWISRAEKLRRATVQTEIDARRKAEGTLKEAPSAVGEFDLPTWDELHFEEQHFGDINLHAQAVAGKWTDVPAFYSGGVFKDGVLQHKLDSSWGQVLLEHDDHVVERLQAAGAYEEANRDPIATDIGGSYKLYGGKQYTLVDEGTVPQNDTPDPLVGDVYYDGVGSQYKIVSTDGDNITVQQVWTSTGADLQTYDPTNDVFSDKTTMAAKDLLGLPSAKRVHRDGPTGERRIEYVHHNQGDWKAGGAATSQRGTMRFIGYTPEQAAEKMQEFGLLGDLEPEVPFTTALRSTRRSGRVVPLHPAYLQGEAPLPKTKARITHGITNTSNGGAIESLKTILGSGGLAAITERHRHGVLKQTKGVSVNGDVRSGIDHAVFCTQDGGGACGAGSSVKFVMKPHAFLRRDVVLTPLDFGGSETRYNQYRKYLNNLQAEAGVPKTNIYEPVDPKVRQVHLNKVSVTSSTEYNLGPTIPVEDIEAIGVSSQADIDDVNAYLDGLLATGQISAKPKVMLNTEASTLANSGLTGG